MTYGIIGAMEIEIKEILSRMTVEKEEKVYGTTYYKGKLFDKDVVLLSCSVAPINAALCTSIAIREFGANAIINTGIAGALAEGFNICDLVISSEVAYHDSQEGVVENWYPYRNSFEADSRLVALAEEAASTIEGLHFTKGLIATGNRFISSTAQKDAIKERLGNPLCVEMEGAAIGHASYVNGVPFVVIRSVSDFSDEAAQENYEENEARAAHNSAKLICEMIRKGL